MKRALKLLVFLIITWISAVEVFAWQGMPTPPLHVEGNKLKDPTGNDVLLHGWMQPDGTYFNGEGNRYSDPTDWTNTSNVAGMLNFLKDAANIMSDPSPKYGQSHGWYASFVRLNCGYIGGFTHENGLVNSSQFNGWIQNFIVPYANHLRSRGLYLLICATGPVNTPNNGSRNAGVTEQARLRTMWSTVANAPGIKNADNIMFELMNEPVQIESSPGNGQWGSGSGTYFQAFRNWMQPVINDIRATGANNVIWVPCLGWQGEPHGWAQYPFTGTNIGVAAHLYPAYGGVYNNAAAMQNLWNSNYKPAADKWPMIITECMWYPGGTGYEDLFNGTTAGFGNNLKNAIDNQGNVSFLVGFLADHLVNLVNTPLANTSLGTHEGTQSFFSWLPEYTWAAPDDGTPKYQYASVTENDPKQIQLIISHPAKKINNYDGFSVKVDSQLVTIDSVVLGDTNQLLIYLSDSILKDNDITLSFSNGNVVSNYEKNLVDFNEAMVNNLLKGASPRITELKTNSDGDTLVAKFNMKMKLPSDISALALNAEYNGDTVVQALQNYIIDNDSTSLLFSLSEKVYSDYRLLFSYSGNNIISSDSGLLKTFSYLQVTNFAQGFPVMMDSGRIEPNGVSVVLEFSKPLGIAVGQSASFNIELNGKSVSFKNFFVLDSTIRLTLSSTAHYGDTVKISYTPGNIKATDGGILEEFIDFQPKSFVAEPEEWLSIPNKIEAENYYLQLGTQTENTSDAGGGLNIGWIDSGDWLEYAIENNTSETNYQIAFRVASGNADGRIDYYLDNKRIRGVAVPNTGGWQKWQSVVKDITVNQGRHYLKIVASTGGFNINYISIQTVSGIKEINDNKIKIYPNPVSTELTIVSKDFQYNKVEIIDMMGKTALHKPTAYEPQLHMQVNLPNGMYIVKISNEKQHQIKKIIVDND